MIFALLMLQPPAESAPPAEPPAAIEPATTSSTDDSAADPSVPPTEPVDPAGAEGAGETTPMVSPEAGAPTADGPAAPLVEAPAEDAAQPVPAPTLTNYTVVQGKPGPPYSTPEEQDVLRARYGLGPLDEQGPEPARFKRAFRCFIADPSCGFNVEINATSAYAYRLRQGSVANADDVNRWSSGRAQYDLWLNFPAASDVVGTRRYTRITLGPKGGVAMSDSDSMWGNAGIAMRAFLGRGSWAPTIELTSAVSFSIRGEKGPVENREIGPVRSPVGLTADLGFGLGGLGSVIFGGQFEPPLAREDLPERIRVSAGGMFFVGFRGNIAWGLPAATAVTTHAVVQRTVEAP